MAENRGVNVATPKGGEHVQSVPADKKDRETYAKQFREQKKHEDKMKDERFAAIRERRKKNGSGGSGGINIEGGPGKD